MKTIQISVNFFVKVPDNTNEDNVCISVDTANIEILDDLKAIEGVKVHEYETIMVEKI